MDKQRRALLDILGRGEPRQLRRLSRALGRNDAYLQQFLQRGSPRQLPEAVRHQLAELLGVDEARLRAEPERLVIPRIVHVPLLEVDARAGSGRFDYVAEDSDAGWPFDRDMLGALYEGAPDDLRLLVVRGDSMSPVLEDGDRVLVNTADTRPSPPGIFVLHDGVGLMIKSLELVPGLTPEQAMIRISSANTHYSAYQRRISELEIKGRIIWFGRRLSR